MSNTGAGLGVNDGFAFNNVFSYPQGQKVYGGDAKGISLVQEHMKFYNNAYTGGIVTYLRRMQILCRQMIWEL